MNLYLDLPCQHNGLPVWTKLVACPIVSLVPFHLDCKLLWAGAALLLSHCLFILIICSFTCLLPPKQNMLALYKYRRMITDRFNMLRQERCCKHTQNVLLHSGFSEGKCGGKERNKKERKWKRKGPLIFFSCYGLYPRKQIEDSEKIKHIYSTVQNI